MPITRSSRMNPEALVKLIRKIVHKEISSALKDKLKPIQDSLSKLQVSVFDSASKIKALGEAANETESRLAQLENDCKLLRSQNELLIKKTEALENHSRTFNIRIFGLKEGVEQGKPTAFVNKLLYDLFGQEALSLPLLVNITHRTGLSKGDCCIIAPLNSFETKRIV